MRGAGMGGGAYGGAVMSGQRRQNWRDELNAAIAKEAAARDKQVTNLRELVFGWHMNDANLNEVRYQDTQAKIERLYWSMCAFAAVVISGEIYQAVTR